MQLNTTPVVLAIAVKANQKRMATARIQIGTHYRLLVEPTGHGRRQPGTRKPASDGRPRTIPPGDNFRSGSECAGGISRPGARVAGDGVHSWRK